MPSARRNRYYEVALKLCNSSNHIKHKMAAVVVRGGAVLSKATNKSAWGAHAEKRALQNLNCAKGAIIFIARNRNRMSRPCTECLNLIKALGIKKIIYSDWDGNLITEKI